jgi:hypothetical protein
VSRFAPWVSQSRPAYSVSHGNRLEPYQVERLRARISTAQEAGTWSERTACSLAANYGVTLRTVYRHAQAGRQAGRCEAGACTEESP